LVLLHDAGAERRNTYHRAIAEGLPAGYGVDDGAALYFRGSEFVEAVSTNPLTRAYRVARVDGRVVETPLPTRLLCGDG
jgi:dipeptidase E